MNLFTRSGQGLLCLGFMALAGCTVGGEPIRTAPDGGRAADMNPGPMDMDHGRDPNSDAGPGGDQGSELDASMNESGLDSTTGLAGSDMNVTPANDAAMRMDTTPALDGTVAIDMSVGSADAHLDDMEMPRDAVPAPESFDEMVARILASHNIQGLTADFNEAEVAQQRAQFGGVVSFDAAFDAALNSFLNDARDLESPLSLVSDIGGDRCLDPDHVERVRCFLNLPTSRITLVGEAGFPPENGEMTSVYWVFYLRMDSLSDHLFWALVHRMGDEPAYNYGFN